MILLCFTLLPKLLNLFIPPKNGSFASPHLEVNTTPLIFILSPGTDPVSDVTWQSAFLVEGDEPLGANNILKTLTIGSCMCSK